jgi:hypothetical protein
MYTYPPWSSGVMVVNRSPPVNALDTAYIAQEYERAGSVTLVEMDRTGGSTTEIHRLSLCSKLCFWGFALGILKHA